MTFFGVKTRRCRRAFLSPRGGRPTRSHSTHHKRVLLLVSGRDDGIEDAASQQGRREGINAPLFSLALGYLSSRLPHKYCHPHAVSPPSSGWIGVVPTRRGHQRETTLPWQGGLAWHGSALHIHHEILFYDVVSRAKTHLLDEDGVMMGQTRSVY